MLLKALLLVSVQCLCAGADIPAGSLVARLGRALENGSAALH